MFKPFKTEILLQIDNLQIRMSKHSPEAGKEKKKKMEPEHMHL